MEHVYTMGLVASFVSGWMIKGFVINVKNMITARKIRRLARKGAFYTVNGLTYTRP